MIEVQCSFKDARRTVNLMLNSDTVAGKNVPDPVLLVIDFDSAIPHVAIKRTRRRNGEAPTIFHCVLPKGIR